MNILYQIEQGKVFDDGYHEIFNEKKTIKYTFTFKNGKLDGRFLEFYKKMEYFFIPKWIKTEEIFFKDGKEEGKYYQYSYKREGIIVNLSNYENGLLQGEQLSFSDEGDIESSSFGPHGLVTSISNYKDGKHHGLFKSYNVREYDGVTLRTLSETGQYVEGEKHGEWISRPNCITILN